MLYSKAREYVGTTKDKVVFDLYSGTGTIAQILAPVAKRLSVLKSWKKSWQQPQKMQKEMDWTTVNLSQMMC